MQITVFLENKKVLWKLIWTFVTLLSILKFPVTYTVILLIQTQHMSRCGFNSHNSRPNLMMITLKMLVWIHETLSSVVTSSNQKYVLKQFSFWDEVMNDLGNFWLKTIFSQFAILSFMVKLTDCLLKIHVLWSMSPPTGQLFELL